MTSDEDLSWAPLDLANLPIGYTVGRDWGVSSCQDLLWIGSTQPVEKVVVDLVDPLFKTF